MILLIDNFDSFTFNIYQYIAKMNLGIIVKRNNEISIESIIDINPSHIIISPGPGRPESAGICLDVIREFKGKIPILGICLGHQCIGLAFGGEIVRSEKIYHGKISSILHDEKEIYNGIPNPFNAIRYHSLVIRKNTIPDELIVTAWSEDEEIMGIRHKNLSVEGVQFHPESIGSEHGLLLLENFINNKTEPFIIKSAIKKVFLKIDLSELEAEKVMEEITSGNATNSQIASLLTSLSLKRETISEITGFAKVMRRKAQIIEKPKGKKVVDTCGTGGDNSGTFNISTLAALVASGAGITVAKHGNRSVTSRCGSADILEALGVNISCDPIKVSQALKSIGIGFLFAPKLHDSMKYAVPVRREIALRTVFNILGPLVNPANAEYQIIGVFAPELTDILARVLINLGTERAMIVHGLDGLDEITLTGKTLISEINNGWYRNYLFNPKDYGFEYCSRDSLKGGDLKTNCEIALAILNGEKGPKRDIVVLNAAAAIYIAKKTDSFKEAIEFAQNSLDEKRASKKLDDLIQISNN